MNSQIAYNLSVANIDIFSVNVSFIYLQFAAWLKCSRRVVLIYLAQEYIVGTKGG